MKVCKFGGTSLADHNQIKKICDIVLSDPDRRVVVVSAPGKRFKEDRKVTDLLISYAEKCLAGEPSEAALAAIVSRFEEIADGLEMSHEFGNTVRKELVRRSRLSMKNRGKFMDCIKAAGEDFCAMLVADYLKHLNVDAVYISPKDAGLLMTHEFGNAQVLPESYKNLARLADSKSIIVFPGFFGYSKGGSVVTFPRGGSDITGSILAAALHAEVYENFSDVDYVYVADPRIVEDPLHLNIVTYREMRELSYGGFSVLHEETLAPVYKSGIPINIRNTNNPSAPGTMIVLKRKYTLGTIAGIACDKGFCSINMMKHLMNREIGFGRKLLEIIEDEGLSFEHMPSGIDYLSLILRESQFTHEIEKRVIARIKSELQVDSVNVQRGLALVLVVGEGMHHSVGLAAKVTSAMAVSGINLVMINQGSSEISMMFGINASDSEKAVKAIYSKFFA